MTNINRIKLPRSKRTQWSTWTLLQIMLTGAAGAALMVVGAKVLDKHITAKAADHAAADYVRDLELAEENRRLRDYNRELLCVLNEKCAMRIKGIEYDMLARVTWYPARVPGK